MFILFRCIREKGKVETRALFKGKKCPSYRREKKEVERGRLGAIVRNKTYLGGPKSRNSCFAASMVSLSSSRISSNSFKSSAADVFFLPDGVAVDVEKIDVIILCRKSSLLMYTRTWNEKKKSQLLAVCLSGTGLFLLNALFCRCNQQFKDLATLI